MNVYQDQRIEDADTDIFSIVTAMTKEDRATFLDTLNIVRNAFQGYAYLEVGSDKGGSIIAPLLDSRCAVALSVDLRPTTQPDERALNYEFLDNSADRMRRLLVEAGVPRGGMLKLLTFDADISALTKSDIGRLCHFVFIDAEHTNRAVFRDFLKVRKFLHDDSIILFHDSQLIFDALVNIDEILQDEANSFCSFYLPSTIYGIAFGSLVTQFKHVFADLAYDKESYVHESRIALRLAVANRLKTS